MGVFLLWLGIPWSLPLGIVAEDALPQVNAAQLFTEAHQKELQGDFAGAEKSYRQFLKLAPESAEGHANLGVVYAHQGKLKEAIGEYELALKINPQLLGLYLNLGIAYFRQENFSLGNVPGTVFKFGTLESAGPPVAGS